MMLKTILAIMLTGVIYDLIATFFQWLEQRRYEARERAKIVYEATRHLDAYMNMIRNEPWFEDEMQLAIEKLSKEVK